MVAIPSVMQNYMMLWLVSLGSSIGLMLVAAAIFLITGDSEVTSLFILMFNATAASFILLTMIPVGIFILIFGTLFNAAAPIVAPVMASVWNFFGEFIAGIFNVPFDSVTFVTQVSRYSRAGELVIPTINVAETIEAVISFLVALQGFLIDAATGGTAQSGSGTFNPNSILKWIVN